jgi:hypothetical protein
MMRDRCLSVSAPAGRLPRRRIPSVVALLQNWQRRLMLQYTEDA